MKLMDDKKELMLFLAGFALLTIFGLLGGSTEDMKVRAFFLAGLAILGFIARPVYRGFKESRQSQVNDASIEQSSGTSQRSMIALRIGWIVKDLLIASLLFAVWIGLTASISDSRGDQISLAYLVCGGQERCAQRAVSEMSEQLLFFARLSSVAVLCVISLAALRCYRLISLSGRVRLATLLLPSSFLPRLRASSKNIFIILAILQMCFFVYSIRSNTDSDAPAIPLQVQPSPPKEPIQQPQSQLNRPSPDNVSPEATGAAVQTAGAAQLPSSLSPLQVLQNCKAVPEVPAVSVAFDGSNRDDVSLRDCGGATFFVTISQKSLKQVCSLDFSLGGANGFKISPGPSKVIISTSYLPGSNGESSPWTVEVNEKNNGLLATSADGEDPKIRCEKDGVLR
jgi:hypothetical protein